MILKGNIAPDGTTVAVTARGSFVLDTPSHYMESTGGTIVDGTASPSSSFYKIFSVQNGSITVTYSAAAAGIGTARIGIVPAFASGTTNGSYVLSGGVWTITIQ